MKIEKAFLSFSALKPKRLVFNYLLSDPENWQNKGLYDFPYGTKVDSLVYFRSDASLHFRPSPQQENKQTNK